MHCVVYSECNSRFFFFLSDDVQGMHADGVSMMIFGVGAIVLRIEAHRDYCFHLKRVDYSKVS